MSRRHLLLLVPLAILAGCAVGPDYRRPQVDTPPAHRDLPGESGTGGAPGDTLGELGWWQLFQDPVLRELVREALQNNHDLRLAAERVLEAQARYGISRSQSFPALDGAGEYQAGRLSAEGNTPATGQHTQDSFYLGLGTFFELDFWGRVRRLNEAARAEVLATESAHRTVRLFLVSEVGATYFNLRELDLELEIARRTKQSRQASLRLVKARREGGVASRLEEDQAQALVSAAAVTLPDLERRIRQQENYLCFLLGRDPGEIPRGRRMEHQLLPPAIPGGLPSDLLERRPDILEAEQQLVAANARIGAARAAYFPQITLTGAAGTLSRDLQNLFAGTSWSWSFTPQLALPIFNAGRVRSGVRVSESQQRQALIAYEQSIRNAFREVADALIDYRKQVEFRQEQELLTQTLSDQARLSRLRYTGGVTSYLEVLDSERQFFDAELSLARAQRDELLAILRLYKSLGGGWHPEPPAGRP